MRARNVVEAIIAASVAMSGMVLGLGALASNVDLSNTMTVIVSIISALVILPLGVAAAIWPSGDGGSAERIDGRGPREVAITLIVAEAAVLLLTWALGWAQTVSPKLSPAVAPVAMSVVGALFIVFAFGVLLSVVRRQPLHRPRQRGQSRGLFDFGPVFAFWLGLTYLAVLLALAFIYAISPSLQKDLQGGVFGGILPIGVPWYGALGAVTIGLYGVFRHNDQWQKKYNFWHVARPLMGAVLGMMAYFIFIAVLNATTSGQTRAIDFTNSQALIVYYVVAFVVGYRESTFRDLIKRAADLLFQPGGVTAEGVIDLLPSPSVAYASAPGVASDPVEIRFVNATGGSVLIDSDGVSVSGAPGAHWTVEAGQGDGKAWFDPGKPAIVASGSSLSIQTRWTPPSDAIPGSTEEAVLTVTYGGHTGPPKKTRLVGKVIPPAAPAPDDAA